MESIKLPILFAREKQEALNQCLQDKTGCFLFLKTDDIFPGIVPTSYADAFIEVVIGLYIVYHDLACLYWKVLLSDDLCPPSFFDKPRLKVIKNHHIDRINSKLRPNITHGFMLARDPQNDDFRESIELLFDKGKNKLLPWGATKTQWPQYMNMMTEGEWKRIVENLVADSDEFYSLLLKWADSWEKAIKDGKTSPRHDFIWSNEFAKSIDRRVIEPYCKKHAIEQPDDNQICLLQDDLRIFFEKNPQKKPDRILKELESQLKAYNNTQSSSLGIGANYGLAFQ